jgi:hypothetical protein
MNAPFPFFGGKREVADIIWARLGSPKQYIEPFCGSAAVLLAAPSPASLEVVNDLNGFICLGPTTRILRGDLSWMEAASIRVGDGLVGFDEHNGPARPGFRAPTKYRRWRLATVTKARPLRRPSYRLTFDDGTTVVASAEHMWLTGPERTGSRGWQWRETRRLLVTEHRASHVLKVAPVVRRDESWEAGWIGGLYDGEGHISGQTGWRVTLSQNEGATLDRARRWLSQHGFRFTEQGAKKCVALCIGGGMQESFRFLMTARPERLIANAIKKLPDSSLYGRDHHAVRLVAKEYLGEQDVVAIETDCHTFVAEGLASHNCNFWRTVKHQPGAVAAEADYPVSHIDLGARHAWLMQQRERLGAELQDPHWPGDPQVAGWWLWGQCSWIGSGWCEWDRKVPHVSDAWRGVQALGKVPHVSDAGRGVQALGQVPHVSDAGRDFRYCEAVGQIPAHHIGGIQSPVKQPDDGRGFLTSAGRVAWDWLHKLADRLERVRVVHGEWSRCLNNHYGDTDTAVFLDPPYRGYGALYGAEAVADEVAAWARENAELRICLCGHVGDYEMGDGWVVVPWKRPRLTYSGSGTTDKEALWFSPPCAGARQGQLF